MAVADSEELHSSRNKRKRDALNDQRKLLVNQRVEVRSFEEGFEGSWHSGIVVSFDEKLVHRLIKYDHLLADDNSGELFETVRVSLVLDCAGESQSPNNRQLGGNIRPFPPTERAQKWELHYGLCVDAEYRDAWWEGVVFDHDDGSSERRVLFPDLGDELVMDIGCLRITHDWDVASGDWRRRGSWVFLEVIEEFEREQGHALPISSKQVWYEVRMEKDFVERGSDWTSGPREFWKEMVYKVCRFYMDLLAEELCRRLKCPEAREDLMSCCGGLTFGGLSSGVSESAQPEEKSEAVVPLEQRVAGRVLSLKIVHGCSGKTTDEPLREGDMTNDGSCVASMLSGSDQPDTAVNCDMSIASHSIALTSENSEKWQLVSPDLLPSAEFCPGAVDEYMKYFSTTQQKPKSRCSAQTDVLKHIIYLGWKIEFSKADGSLRKRYTLPGESCLYSLNQVCKHLKKSSGTRLLEQLPESLDPDTCPQASVSAEGMDPLSDELESAQPEAEQLSSLAVVPLEQRVTDRVLSIKIVHGFSGKSTNESLRQNDVTTAGPCDELTASRLIVLGSKNTGKWKPFSINMHPSAEFCPDSVDEYMECFSKESKRSKSRSTVQADLLKHLSYLGCKFEYSTDDGFIRKRYTLPGEKCLYSLKEVCKHLRTSIVIQPFEQLQEVQVPDTCPEAAMYAEGMLLDYCYQVLNEYKRGRGNIGRKIFNDLRPKAEEQLVTHGWVLIPRANHKKRKRNVPMYESPSGKKLYSLKSACEVWCNERMKRTSSACSPYRRVRFFCGKKSDSTCNTISLPTSDSEFQEKMVQPSTLLELLSEEPSRDMCKVKVKGIRKARKKRYGNFLELSAHKVFQSHTNGPSSPEKDGVSDQPKDQNFSHQKAKLSKATSTTVVKSKLAQVVTRPTCSLKSSKRVRDVVIPNSSHRNPLSVLSWLIDNNAVLPRAKVHCINKKKKCKLVEGRINCRGIKCGCCSNMFTLSGFAVHAGNNRSKAAANIFLDDGRSILDCEKLSISKSETFASESLDEMKSNWSKGENDYICSVCHYGGELMLCDQCPASFHKNCLGLKDIPEGEWFCPSCHCRKCGISNFQRDKEHAKDGIILTCSQCELKYHVGCLDLGQLGTTKSDPRKKWFCSKSCNKIYIKLQKLLGEQTTLNADNLTWSLLKTMKTKNNKANSEIDAAEIYIKLKVALIVMHECFKPVKEAHSRRDLMEDVIFNRESELQRLNFRGFYTAVLTRNDEVISVATVRIHGKEVAEIPLVGTRFQYRRLGMCRILMKELEKTLMQLGVERLVLPAVPSVLSTWTGSFGFSEMTASERLHFLDHTFLDFQGTIMCQKLLTNVPSTELHTLKGARPGSCGDLCQKGHNTDTDRSSAVSEVYQAEQNEDIQFAIASQGQRGFSAYHKFGTENSLADVDVAVRHTQNSKIRPCFGAIETSENFSPNTEKRPESGNSFKYYKRRKQLV